jgi:hypothetical protein
MINTPAQRKLLHTWIISVIVKQHLVNIYRTAQEGRGRHVSRGGGRRRVEQGGQDRIWRGKRRGQSEERGKGWNGMGF